MSILIRGMEMPKSCYKCPMKRRDGMDIVCPVAHERFSVADVNILEYRLDNCPITPVPPHGRLIEESKVLDIVSEWCPDDDGSVGKYGDLREMLDEIEALPTIIPASEEGKT